MKGSGASLYKANATSPKPTDARKHMRRKYYSMRCRSFQGIVGNEERMILMTNILEEFAYGNLSPEVCAFRHDSEYGEVLRVLSLNEERLLARLNEEDKNVFENYVGPRGAEQAHGGRQPDLRLPAGPYHDGRSLCRHGRFDFRQNKQLE